MAIAWTKTGDYYVHKTLGSDISGDGSAQSPFASLYKARITAATGSTIIVSAGVWSDSVGGDTTKVLTWVADGYAVIDLSVLLSDGYVFGSKHTLDGFTVFNPLGRYLFQPQYTSRVGLINCVVDTLSIGTGMILTAVGTVIEHVQMSGLSATYSFRHTLTQSTILKYSSVNAVWDTLMFATSKNSVVGVIGDKISFSIDAANGGKAIHCCFMSGTISGTDGIIADPMFTNANVGDYTLTLDSPCLYSGYLGAHIGARGLGMRIDANHASFNKGNGAVYTSSDALTDDLVRSIIDVGGYNDTVFVLNTGKASGSVTSAWIDLAKVRDISGLIMRINAEANSSGVPIVVPSRSYSNENMRYLYRMRHSVDVAGKVTAVWSDMEVLSYNAVSISARYIQLELSLLTC